MIKVFLFFTLAIYSTSAALSAKSVAAEWRSFKTKFNKKFSNATEEASRKEIFQKNIERFETHNELYKQGLVTYTLGINQFADMTPEEIRLSHKGLTPPKIQPESRMKIKSKNDFILTKSYQLPSSIDWRYFGVVTPVKDQGECSSCWAFAANAAIESHHKIAYGSNIPISVSEQQLIDCTPYSNGCTSGAITDAFYYVVTNNGIDSEISYPYEDRQGMCRFRPDQVAAKITNFVSLTVPDENLLAYMVATAGPVAAGIHADDNFSTCQGGIYSNPNCPTDLNHAVLIIGYGTENGQDYWLVKNSWGPWWGEGGFLKMARNQNNSCGIASLASYPVL